MTIKTSNVLPNFAKGLTVFAILMLSFSAFAEHHGGAEEKAGHAIDMAKDKGADGIKAMELKEDSVLTEEEIKLKMKMDEAKLKEMMKDGAEALPE